VLVGGDWQTVDMNETLSSLIIGLFIGVVVGFLVAWVVLSRRKTVQAGEDPVALRAQIDMLQRQHEELRGDQDKENKILQALAPVSERLNDMQRTVAELEKQRSEQHGQIAQQLRAAVQSDELLRGTAEQLASALRSNSVRGVW